MARVIFPRLLSPIVGPDLVVQVTAATVEELCDALEAARPGVSHHLFDSTGTLRPHVLCFIDDEASRLADPEQVIHPDATVRVIQAVSGG